MTIALSPAADRSASRGLGLSIGLAIVAGLLLTAGYALHPLWWAPLLAPVALIPAGAGSARQARVTGAVAGFVAQLSIVPYYIGMIGWVGTILIALLRINSWLFAASLTHAAARRLPLWAATPVMPATIAALEMLTLVISPHGAAGSLAYSQMDVPATIQTASLGGVPTVVFVILLPGSLAGLLLARSWPRRQTVIGLALATVVAFAIGLFTLLRLGTQATGPAIPVTMIATDRFSGIPKAWDPVWETYRPAIEQGAKPGGLVVLPEKIALLDGPGAARAALMVAAAARRASATIVVGIEVEDAGTYHNRALVAAPDGRTAWYDKQRPVPGLEARDVPGKTPLLTDLTGARLGVAICKDMHIPSIGREYAGVAALMAVPAWDFGQDGWMGARMSALRAVENGYAIARSARDGFVGAYDRAGRALIERPSGEGLTIADAVLPAAAHQTVYARIGDVFGWMLIAAIVLLTAWLRRPIARRAIAK